MDIKNYVAEAEAIKGLGPLATYQELLQMMFKKPLTMRIVLAGASGTGKSTLAKFISETYKIPYTENSAGMVMLPEDKEALKHRWNYQGNWGQAGVLDFCYAHPLFGQQFNRAILRARTRLATISDHYVYDRSALDPAVFWLHQVAHATTHQQTQDFIESCAKVMQNYDVIIYLPLVTTDRSIDKVTVEAEEEGGRLANKFFQWKMDKLFLETYKLIHHMNHVYGWKFNLPGIFAMDVWNWQVRTGKVISLIENMHTSSRIKLPQTIS